MNLVAFSFPDKVWRPFAEKLDQNLRLMFTDYAKNGCRVTWLTAPADWDGVLAAVTAGQRQTLEARSEGETDLDFLLRNLERVAVASPVAETWYGWAVGYHAIEAAVTLNAGLDSVAQWHHGLGSSYDTYLRRVDLAPPAAAATPAKPSGS